MYFKPNYKLYVILYNITNKMLNVNFTQKMLTLMLRSIREMKNNIY